MLEYWNNVQSQKTEFTIQETIYRTGNPNGETKNFWNIGISELGNKGKSRERLILFGVAYPFNSLGNVGGQKSCQILDEFHLYLQCLIGFRFHGGVDPYQGSIRPVLCKAIPDEVEFV